MNKLNWKLEDYKLMNDEKEKVWGQNSPKFKDGNKIYKIEKDFTLEEKQEIIDDMYNGLATLILSQIKQWKATIPSVKHDEYGKMKRVSKKAALKKVFLKKPYEAKGIEEYVYFRLDTDNMYFTVFGGVANKEFDTETPTTEYGYSVEYTNQHIVHQWFHDMLVLLERKEKEHFQKHDKKEILLKEVRELGQRYTIFNNKKVNDIVYNRDNDVTVEELEYILEQFDKIKEFYEKMYKEFEDFHPELTFED